MEAKYGKVNEKQRDIFYMRNCKMHSIRALALKNAKVIFKAFLTFLRIKVLASNNAKPHYCKIFCNSATVQF